jgi:hypothetical protein
VSGAGPGGGAETRRGSGTAAGAAVGTGGAGGGLGVLMRSAWACAASSVRKPPILPATPGLFLVPHPPGAATSFHPGHKRLLRIGSQLRRRVRPGDARHHAQAPRRFHRRSVLGGAESPALVGPGHGESGTGTARPVLQEKGQISLGEAQMAPEPGVRNPLSGSLLPQPGSRNAQTCGSLVGRPQQPSCLRCLPPGQGANFHVRALCRFVPESGPLRWFPRIGWVLLFRCRFPGGDSGLERATHACS